MKSLSTLIKLQKTYVDEQRLMLARLQDRLTRIEQAILQLEHDKIHEQAEAKKDTAHAVTYGAFLDAAIKRGRKLEVDRQNAEASVNAARDRLTELYEEQKRYEIAEAARIEAALKEELRQETAELDEIGGVTHERRKTK